MASISDFVALLTGCGDDPSLQRGTLKQISDLLVVRLREVLIPEADGDERLWS